MIPPSSFGKHHLSLTILGTTLRPISNISFDRSKYETTDQIFLDNDRKEQDRALQSRQPSYQDSSASFHLDDDSCHYSDTRIDRRHAGSAWVESVDLTIPHVKTTL